VKIHLQARREFHHLISLDVLQSVDASDTVTNAQHTAGFLQVSLWRSSHDAFFEDGADLSTA
jgi:hypothetical protein